MARSPKSMNLSHSQFHTETPGSNHNHSHNYRGIEKKRLILAILLTAIMLAVEVAGGIMANSLALLSDAGHMFTHMIALGISYIAIRFSEKDATEKMTFGFHRAEILAALANGVTLLLLTIWIGYEAYRRFFEPGHVNSVQMFWIALLGLAVNIATALILRDASHHSINIRSAFLHMLGDTLSSIGVIAGAIAIYFKGWLILDPILGIGLCIPIVIWSYNLIMESVDVLLEATPKGIDIGKVKEGIMEMENVAVVHDIHVWTLTSGFHAMSAHVGIADLHISETTELLNRINELLKSRFRIGHSTIQFECVDRCDTKCR